MNDIKKAKGFCFKTQDNLSKLNVLECGANTDRDRKEGKSDENLKNAFTSNDYSFQMRNNYLFADYSKKCNLLRKDPFFIQETFSGPKEDKSNEKVAEIFIFNTNKEIIASSIQKNN